MKERKNYLKRGIIALSVILICSACEKLNEDSVEEVIGTYKGTLSSQIALKSSKVAETLIDSAKAVVTIESNGKILVHCIGGGLDTTFMLSYYENHDSLMVCLEGEEFESMYGHMPGEGHMGGGMMGDINNGESNWEHHMNDEHQEGDEHFGSFDMMDKTFTYLFIMENDGNTAYQRFHGIKMN